MFYVQVNDEPIGFYEHIETAMERARANKAKVFRDDEVLIYVTEPPPRPKFVFRSLRP